MFAENPANYMRDFGEPATWYGAPWSIDRTGASIDSSAFGPGGLQTQTALVIFDEPDEDVGSHVQSRGYKMTFPSSQFVGIKRGDALLIASGLHAGNYSCMTPKLIDDGVFTEVQLQAL